MSEEPGAIHSITKQPLDMAEFPKGSAFWANGCVLATTEDLQIRYEALRSFLGYSASNVRTFSEAQQALRMEPLRGGSVDRDKKYIPEIYVPREETRNAIGRFMNGSGTAFALVGASGVGKTNEMCALAEELGKKHIALFFVGGALHASIADTLVEEFDWHFSDHIGGPELVRRLANIAQHINCRVVIVVDAVDEAAVAGFEQSTAEFATRLLACDGHVKLVVSAKLEEWHRFITFRGDPSPLRLALDTSWSVAPEATFEQSAGPDQRALLLPSFSDRELEAATEKYRTFFNLSDVPRSRLREHCRVAFVLRVTSEVYGGKQRPLPSDMSEEQLLREWLEQKLRRMENPDGARMQLEAVARALYEEARIPTERLITYAEAERVPAKKVREAARSPMDAPIADELVANGVLVRHADADGRIYLAFYYGRLRDYMIARHVLVLDRMTTGQFQEAANTLLSGHVLQGALFWHMRHASSVQQFALDELVGTRAAAYLSTYERIMDELVPGLKPGIDPYTRGPIGLAYELTATGLLSSGFYPVGKVRSERLLELHTTAGDQRMDEFSQEVWKIGGHMTRSGGKNFTNTDGRMAAAEDALRLITEAVRNGQMEETGSPVVVRESVFAIATAHSKTLGFPSTSALPGILSQTSSFDLDALMVRIQMHFGREHYKHQWVREQYERNSEYATKDEIGSTASVVLDPAALRPLIRRAESEAMSGTRFPNSNVQGQRDLNVLVSLVDLLLAAGQRTINPVFPSPDVSPPNPTYSPHEIYSNEQLTKVLECYFTEGIRAYKTLIEANFSGLLECFELYRKLPVAAVVSYSRPRQNKEWDWGTVEYGFLPINGKDSIAEIHIDSKTPVFHLGSQRVTVLLGGKPVSSGFSSTGLRGLLSPYDAPGFRSKRKGSEAARLAPIRALAYDLINNEISRLGMEEILARIGEAS